MLIGRVAFDFLRFIKRVKPLFEDDTLQFEPDIAKRLKLLQEAVYVVCMGFAGDNQMAPLGHAKISWPQKEEFILTELKWLETLAQEYRARIPTLV